MSALTIAIVAILITAVNVEMQRRLIASLEDRFAELESDWRITHVREPIVGLLEAMRDEH